MYLDGALWLRSAPITARVSGKNYSSADNTLRLTGNRSDTGCDAIGDFSMVTLEWRAGVVAFETAFRSYTKIGAVIFEQRFPQGATGTANAGAHASATVFSAFPAFDFARTTTSPSSPTSGGPRAYVQLAGKGVPTNGGGCHMGPWPPNATERTSHRCQGGGALDHEDGSPNELSGGWEGAGAIAIFDATATKTVVLSPASAFTTTQAVHTDDVLSFGPRGSITAVPAGFGSSVIAFVGKKGIGRTLRLWGLALMRKGGKDPDLWKHDFSLNYLGYTTDNGAYYYYKTEVGKNYEQTILDLKKYTVQQAVPVRWILYLLHSITSATVFMRKTKKQIYRKIIKIC